MQLIRVTAVDVLILTTTGVAALNDFSNCNKKLLRRNFPETIDDNVPGLAAVPEFRVASAWLLKIKKNPGYELLTMIPTELVIP